MGFEFDSILNRVNIKTVFVKVEIMNDQKLKQFYKQEIKRLLEILKKYQPEKIILFGSCVKHKMHQGSDVDLCIIKKFRGLRIKQKQRISDLLWKNGFNYNIEPDFHIYTPQIFNRELKEGHPFINKIYNTGQLIYEKSK